MTRRQPKTPQNKQPFGFCTVRGCLKPFNRQQDLKRHLIEFHGPKKRCVCTHKGCDYYVRRLHRLKLHLGSKHGLGKEEAALEAARMVVTTTQLFARPRKNDSSNFGTQHRADFWSGGIYLPQIFPETEYRLTSSLPPSASSSRSTPRHFELHANWTEQIITPDTTAISDAISLRDLEAYGEEEVVESFTEMLNDDTFTLFSVGLDDMFDKGDESPEEDAADQWSERG